MRGPIPRMKVIAGSVKPSRAAVFPEGTPRRPEWLSRAAATEWTRIVPELEAAGLLSLVDRAALAAYCQAWAELQETTKIIEAEGRIYKEPIQSAAGKIVGHKLKAHPVVRLQRDAFNRVRQYVLEFGFTPAARARISTAGGSSPKAAMEPEDRLAGISSRVREARQATPARG
jgi:P27 family predicted phage terminase small subunit